MHKIEKILLNRVSSADNRHRFKKNCLAICNNFQ